MCVCVEMQDVFSSILLSLNKQDGRPGPEGDVGVASDGKGRERIYLGASGTPHVLVPFGERGVRDCGLRPRSALR